MRPVLLPWMSLLACLRMGPVLLLQMRPWACLRMGPVLLLSLVCKRLPCLGLWMARTLWTVLARAGCSSSGQGVLDCRGNVVNKRGFGQNVLAMTVRANLALIL